MASAAQSASLSFAQFLERMKSPAAADLVRTIKAFIRDFETRIKDPNFTVEGSSAMVQDFLGRMDVSFRDHPAWKDASPEVLDQAVEGLEKYLMSKLWAKTFAVCREDRDRDERYFRLASALSFVELRTLMGEDVEISPEPSLFGAATGELARMDKYKAPYDKIICLMNVKTLVEDIVNSAVRSGANIGGADAFFPVFLLVVIRARLPHLASTIEYLRRYRSKSRLSGQFDYMLVNLESAGMYLDTVDWKHLKISQEEFLARLAEAGIPEAQLELSSCYDESIVGSLEPHSDEKSDDKEFFPWKETHEVNVYEARTSDESVDIGHVDASAMKEALVDEPPGETTNLSDDLLLGFGKIAEANAASAVQIRQQEDTVQNLLDVGMEPQYIYDNKDHATGEDATENQSTVPRVSEGIAAGRQRDVNVSPLDASDESQDLIFVKSGALASTHDQRLESAASNAHEAPRDVEPKASALQEEDDMHDAIKSCCGEAEISSIPNHEDTDKMEKSIPQTSSAAFKEDAVEVLVQGISDVLREEASGRLLELYPWIYASADDLTIRDVGSLLAAYRELVLRHAVLAATLRNDVDVQASEKRKDAPDEKNTRLHTKGSVPRNRFPGENVDWQLIAKDLLQMLVTSGKYSTSSLDAQRTDEHGVDSNRQEQISNGLESKVSDSRSMLLSLFSSPRTEDRSMDGGDASTK